MSGGGGGGGSQNITSTVTQKTEPPAYVTPYATSMLSGGAQIASQPYQQYPGMTVAPLSPEQQAAMYMTGQRATSGSPVTQSAGNALQNVMGGAGMQYGMDLASNPLAQQYASTAAPSIGQYQAGQNPLSAIGTNPVGQNALLGLNNPYLNDAIQLAQRDMLPQYGYMARDSGSFGNSGINQAVARTMGDISSQMRMQDYNLQAQLGESDLARRNAAWEAGANRQMDVWGQEEQRRQAGYEAEAARKMTAWESQRNAQQNAAEAQRAAQLGAWGDETGRMLQAAQLAPSIAGEDYTDAKMLMGIGDAKRAYQQELIDRSVGAWDAEQNWPYSQYDWFANILRGAGFGTYGTGSSTTTQPNPNASSGLASLIGGGLAGAGLLSGLF
jgi:hypothetical protein